MFSLCAIRRCLAHNTFSENSIIDKNTAIESNEKLIDDIKARDEVSQVYFTTLLTRYSLSGYSSLW